VHLDESGRAQARAAAERLAGLPLAAVVTSPLERCRETARELVRGHPAAPPLHSDRGLLEVDYGAWSGRPLKELAKEPLWKVVQAHPAAATFPDGESMGAMSARVVAAVRRWDAAVEAEHGPQAVWVAVSHGDPVKAVIADALGLHLDQFQRVVVDPASFSVVRYTPTRPFVVAVNTTAGDLSGLAPPRRGRRRARSGDAVVGGGVGGGAGGPE
jgi:probable phosphomutase (TIGR03848 family)